MANEALKDSLIYHVYFGKASAVKRLVDKGADPDTRDEHNWPVLAVAADRSNKEAYPIAQALIAAGADVNAAHGRNYPLINAIKNNNVPLVALLINADADLEVIGPEGNRAYELAKKFNNPSIIYFFEKKFFEQRQTQEFLKSRQHLKQLVSQYGFHHCAFQYWGYYLYSKQDKDMDEPAVKRKMQHHANAAAEIGERAHRYFPQTFDNQFETIAGKQRAYINKILNDMISNRNRRRKGVGKTEDMLERCHVDKTPAYFHAIAGRYP